MATQEKKPTIPIGIDLGTTNCCVAVCHTKDKDRIEVIHNKQGAYITPSYVAFTKGAKLVGERAVTQMSITPKQCLFDSKRLIGKSYDDQDVQAKLKQWERMFTLKPNAKREPTYSVEVDGQARDYSPTFVSALLLQELKEQAQKYVGEDFEVTYAVITVPAYFKEPQRLATIDAARIAGIDCLQLLNEPTSAAFSYKLNRISNQSKNKNVIAFDLGGGTFDVSLVQVTANNVEVVATNGDMHLGGQDFTWKILDHCLFVIENENQIKKDSLSDKDMARLRKQCEFAKRVLSSDEQYEFEFYVQGEEINLTIDRLTFDTLIQEDVNKCIDIVKLVLKDGKLTREEVDDIVLAGGSTRIPMVRESLQKFFEGKMLNEQINPDQAVAQGAARMAQHLHDSKQGKTALPNDPKIVNIVPIPLGVKTVGQNMDIIIQKNTRLPYQVMQVYDTESEYQSVAEIVVLEGDHELADHCTVLNQFDLLISGENTIKVAQIEVTFSIDLNQILTVNAKVRQTDSQQTVTVNRQKGHLSEKQTALAAQELHISAKSTPQERSNLRKFYKLDNLLDHISSELLKSESLPLGKEEQRKLKQAVEDNQEWVRANREESEAIIDKQYSKLVQNIKQIVGDQQAEKLQQFQTLGEEAPSPSSSSSPKMPFKPHPITFANGHSSPVGPWQANPPKDPANSSFKQDNQEEYINHHKQREKSGCLFSCFGF